jgi:hypothetical protein
LCVPSPNTPAAQRAALIPLIVKAVCRRAGEARYQR